VQTVREIVATEAAPQAIGPYSQAISTGDFVFTSGQIPIDPKTGVFVEGGIAEQTEQVLRNLSEVLRAAGTSLEAVVKTTVYLADMDDFAAMNEVYGRYFSNEPPARSTVQAARLPRDARVEIDVIALKTVTGDK
jgi:2-iminobutanoate/2-iminopropanoate deaminase